jgi:hypothetical protein
MFCYGLVRFLDPTSNHQGNGTGTLRHYFQSFFSTFKVQSIPKDFSGFLMKNLDEISLFTDKGVCGSGYYTVMVPYLELAGSTKLFFLEVSIYCYLILAKEVVTMYLFISM